MHFAAVSRSVGILVAAATLAACAPNSRRAACEPLKGTGCDDGERCVVDVRGEPACLAGTATAELDAPCDAPGDCPEGAACLAIDGLALCRLFCNPQQPVGVETCRDWRDDARCVASVNGHPELGLCVRPCATPGATAAACAPAEAASACWVPPGLDFAVCSGTPGDAVEGAPCGPDTRCAPDLLCAPLGAAATCRTVAPCEVGLFELPYPEAARHRYCAPCRPVAGPLPGDGDAVRYLVCAAEEDVAAAGARCRAEGGRLLGIDVGVEAGLGEVAATAVDGAVLFVGGCWVDGASAACATGHALCRIDTGR